jgi:hypothetical protein
MMNLRITAANGMVDIMTEDKQGNNAFTFANIKGMYVKGDGVGLQVNDEAREADIEKLGQAIVNALYEYGSKYPDSGILGMKLAGSSRAA